jgi:hypothetical protein
MEAGQEAIKPIVPLTLGLDHEPVTHPRNRSSVRRARHYSPYKPAKYKKKWRGRKDETASGGSARTDTDTDRAQTQG